MDRRALVLQERLMDDKVTQLANVRSIEHVWIPMPDGVRLAARIWMPAHLPREGAPAILEYIPYRKADMVRARDERNHPFLAEHGYVSLRVDMRGSGDSDGVMADMYAPAELADVRHAINWIASQDWCNGHVGMFGTSWGGTASLQACIDPPEALKAIIAVCATHDRYEDDIHHKGGCLITDTFEWGATLPSILALPPTPHSGADWYKRWLARLDALTFPVETWVQEEARGTYWRHGSVKQQAQRLGCPVLSLGGWSDRYSNSVMSLVDANPNKAWGIVGPWGHHYPDQGHPGPAIGFQQVALEWWEHWLKPNPDQAAPWPKLRVWMREFDPPQDAMDHRNGSWVQTGPAAEQTTPVEFWLCDDQTLALEQPVTAQNWALSMNLSHGFASGDTGYFGRFGGLPLDQTEDDDRALCFETPPLDEDLLLYGSVELELEVTADIARSQLCARLNDVSPEGVSSRVGLSVLNLALDAKLDAPETLDEVNGKSVLLRFHTTAYRFHAGHRIRVALAPSYWPTVWTPPTTGCVRVKGGRLIFPILPDTPQALRKPFPNPEDLPATKNFETLKAPRLTRSRETLSQGELLLTWHQPPTSVHFKDIDTRFSYETKAAYSIRPTETNSAKTEVIHHMRLDRPDGSAAVTSRIEATATEQTYHLNGHIEVFWSGDAICERQWSCTVNRRFS